MPSSPWRGSPSTAFALGVASGVTASVEAFALDALALAGFASLAVVDSGASAGAAASVALASRVTPSAGLDVDGTSRTLTLPPAASIFARAEALNASATTNSGTDRSPAPRIFIGLFSVRTSPTARRMSWLTVMGAALAGFLPPSSSNAPPSASAPMAPTLTTSYSILKRFLKPRSLGMRMWSGVWPPSNQAGMEPPARAFWPFVPRPAVLPLPAAMPRPTRVRG